MRVLLISRDERHAFLLEQLELEGHKGCLLCKEDTGAWRGLVERAVDLNAARQWGPDIILIDSPGFGPLAKLLADEGYKVFGGSKLQDRLAEDYLYGMSLLEQAGVPTNDYTKFTDIADASDYVRGKIHPWLMRSPDGSSYNAESDVELQLYLERLCQLNQIPPTFTLQRGFPEFVDHSLVIRPSYYLAGLFNSEGLMNPCLKLDMSYNLLPDGQGVPTVEGVNLKSVPVTEALPQATLKRLEATLKVFNYTGFVFLGVMSAPASGGRTMNEEAPPAKEVVVDFQLSPPDGF